MKSMHCRLVDGKTALHTDGKEVPIPKSPQSDPINWRHKANKSCLYVLCIDVHALLKCEFVISCLNVKEPKLGKNKC